MLTKYLKALSLCTDKSKQARPGLEWVHYKNEYLEATDGKIFLRIYLATKEIQEIKEELLKFNCELTDGLLFRVEHGIITNIVKNIIYPKTEVFIPESWFVTDIATALSFEMYSKISKIYRLLAYKDVGWFPDHREKKLAIQLKRVNNFILAVMPIREGE